MDGLLWALFASAFLSATLLPGNSEIVLIVALHEGSPFWPAVLIATIGNTLGGISTYAVGHVFPAAEPPVNSERLRIDVERPVCLTQQEVD